MPFAFVGVVRSGSWLIGVVPFVERKFFGIELWYCVLLPVLCVVVVVIVVLVFANLLH